MQTDSLGQLIDRLIIAHLKRFHYDQDHKVEATQLAQEQVDELAVALEVYDWECRAGQRLPRVQRHLRYHDHNETEAWRAGKKATGAMPLTLAGCVAALAQVHCEYWAAQSRIQGLKKCIDGSPDPGEKAHFEHELVTLQRQKIDLSNQRRNELIQHLDQLYGRMLSREKPLEVHKVRVDGQGPVTVYSTAVRS